jgi:hypothetical protein
MYAITVHKENAMTKAERKQLIKQMRDEANSDSQAQLAELLEDIFETLDAIKAIQDAAEEAKPPKRKYT